MPLRKLSLSRNPPTRIRRRPVSGQLPLSLRPKERLAQRRRRARIRTVFISLLFLAGATWGVGALSYHDRFAIRDIDIIGAAALSEKTVRAAFETGLYDGAYHFLSRDNIFLYPEKEVSLELQKELPRIKSVNVSRDSLLAQAITVSIEERSPTHRWCLSAQTGSERCYLMDETGLIFAFDDGTEVLYTFRGGLAPDKSPIGQQFLRGELPDVLELFTLLNEIGFTPDGATVENETDFTVSLERGFSLKVSFKSESRDVVKNLQLILISDTLQGNEDKLDYVDLRFGNRVYYQMKQ